MQRWTKERTKMICVNGQEIMYEGDTDTLAQEAIGALMTIYDECDNELTRFTMLSVLKQQFNERFENNE